MAVSQPPTENLAEFNSTVFKDANIESLSLSKAQSLFLARTGTPTSQATSTTFTGAISANSATITNDLTLTSGAIKNTQSKNVSIGNNCLNFANYKPSNPTGFINNIAISNFGALSSLTTRANPILNESSDNIAIGYKALNAATYNSSNIAIGSGALEKNASGPACVAIGVNAAYNYNVNASITAIGYRALYESNSYGNTALGSAAYESGNFIQSTAIGDNTVITGARATALGQGASAGANQVVLGTATERVICPGTTNNTSLQLSRGLVLQSTYGTVASTMLGYQISLTSISFTNAQIENGVCVIGSLALTSGVWSINYTVEVSNSGTIDSASTNNQFFYFSNTNGGGYTSRIANTGAVSNIGVYYPVGTMSIDSGGGCLYTSAGQTIYPSFFMTKDYGTVTAKGWANATRIG